MARKTLVFQSHTHMLRGGGELSLLAILKDSKSRGYDVHVIVPMAGDFSDAAKKAEVQVHIIPSYWWTNNNRNELEPWLHKKAIRRTRKLLGSLQPLACITNTVTTPWLAYAAYTTGLPHIWILREYGYSDHGLVFWLNQPALMRALDDLSAKVFVNSAVLREHYAKLTKRTDIGIVVPQVTTPAVTNRENPFRSSALKLVCVGNFSEGKGQLDAVKAVRIIKESGIDVQLALVGIAAQEAYLQKIVSYINKHGLENNILMPGYQQYPGNYISHADISLVCSRTETFGRVTIESLLLGTPVIGVAGANTLELLDKNDSFLYRFGDANELATKILNFYNSSKDLLGDVKKIQNKIKDTYSPAHAHDQFFTYLESLNANNRPTPHNDYPPLSRVLNEQQKNIKNKPIRYYLKKSRRAVGAVLYRTKRLANRHSANRKKGL